MPRQRKAIDSAAVRELGLYIENDGDLQAARAFEVEHPEVRRKGGGSVVKMKRSR